MPTLQSAARRVRDRSGRCSERGRADDRLRAGGIVRVDAVAGTLATAAGLPGRGDAPAPAPGCSLGRGSCEAFRRRVGGAGRGARALSDG